MKRQQWLMVPSMSLVILFACTIPPDTLSDAITAAKIKLLQAQIEELENQPLPSVPAPQPTPTPLNEPSPTPSAPMANRPVGPAATPTPTPIPTPTPDPRPPLERIASVKFTKTPHPIGLKVTLVFLNEATETLEWQWEGNVTLRYMIRDQKNNWELNTETVVRLTQAKPFFVAEGDFDYLHDVLKKDDVNITYALTLPNGKVLSAKNQTIEGPQPLPSPSPSSSPSPSPTAQGGKT